MSYIFNVEDRKQFYQLKRQLILIEDQIRTLESELALSQYKNNSIHLRSMKNESLTQAFILGDIPYLDLSPEKAFEIYENQNKDFCLLDVSRNVFIETNEIIPMPESVQIQFDELHERQNELGGKHRTILVISEDGTSSILACKKLCELGFLNVNNISGGHKFWPGHRQEAKVSK